MRNQGNSEESFLEQLAKNIEIHSSRRDIKILDNIAMRIEKSDPFEEGNHSALILDYIVRTLSCLAYITKDNFRSAAYSGMRAGKAAADLGWYSDAIEVYTN